jgi:hypothetical protein
MYDWIVWLEYNQCEVNSIYGRRSNGSVLPENLFR